MLGIPVRTLCTEYDKKYTLVVEGFRDTFGQEMERQEIVVHTLPKTEPDKKYEEHDSIALQAAEEGIVLLKNKNNLLPLDETSKIWIFGGEKFRSGAAGAGKINPRYTIGLLRAIQEESRFYISENAETAVFVISRPSGENLDNNAVKDEFYLSEEEENELKILREKYSHLIAVLNSGYPMDVRWLEKYDVEAALWCGFPGMLGGKAVVEILDGRVNPSGKLPDTWSLNYWDIPSSANFYQPRTPEEALGSDSTTYVDTFYEEDLYVGYRYFETFDKPVAYPFGHGLSYTTFQMNTTMRDRKITVEVVNTGERAGKEVIQVYARIPEGKLEQPMKRLAAFGKTRILEPEEKQEFEFEIPDERLSSFDTENAGWIMEPGEYQFYVGNSIKNLKKCGSWNLENESCIRKSENLMKPPVKFKTLSKRSDWLPEGKHSGIRSGASSLEILSARRNYPEEICSEKDAVDEYSIEELARLSVCDSQGWGMQDTGVAGRIFRLENRQIPAYAVADGNNGVNIHRRNIGMPCSNTVCASWNTELVYEVGRVIAEEAKENDVQMILAPAVNLHRNPLNGRHPEYFSEDPYLAGVMGGYQSKGLEENGVSSCIKHTIANNCETTRKRNHSLMTERAMRELYLKVFEIALQIHQPDAMMTAYNAVNGCFAAEDEEMIQGIFRGEFGFKGFVMTDWNSYDTADVVSAVQAGNCWFTPGSSDDTYVRPIVEGVKDGRIQEDRLRANVRNMLRVVRKRTDRDLGVRD